MICSIAYLFYQSVWGLIPGVLLIPFMIGWDREEQRKQRRNHLRGEFKEALLMIASSIQVGYSVENAFKTTQEDIGKMYGMTSMFYLALKKINSKVKMNMPIEQAYMEFAKTSGLEEAQSFGEIFVFAKRTGGDYGNIIRKTALRIEQKIEVEEEINTLIAEKQLEMKIMSMMPLAILLYIRTASYEFLQVLYHNPLGIFIMSLCLLVYVFAIVVGRRIVTIQV